MQLGGFINSCEALGCESQGLSQHGYNIISTGGSASAIEAAGIPVQRVEEVTGFPEMLDGASCAAWPSGPIATCHA